MYKILLFSFFLDTVYCIFYAPDMTRIVEILKYQVPCAALIRPLSSVRIMLSAGMHRNPKSL